MSTEPRLSHRLAAVVAALPLRPGLRVLEIGGAPGATAQTVARRIGDGHILVIDRSAKGVARTEQNAAAEIAAGLLSVRHVAAEDFQLLRDEAPFDLAFAIRVGCLDGRHPQAGVRARQRIAAALTPDGRLFIDGGDPLRPVDLADARATSQAPDGRRAGLLGDAARPRPPAGGEVSSPSP